MQLQPQYYEPPKQSDTIYVSNPEAQDGWSKTFVRETVAPTLNGCFKVRDAVGNLMIVKRFKPKDAGLSKAWKFVSGS